jgi:dienelactone hydrolase
MPDTDSLRQQLRMWLNLRESLHKLDFVVADAYDGPHFERQLIHYLGSDGDQIPAYLFLPKRPVHPAAAVVIHHQHNGERHFGKSEPSGLVGNPIQAFGPALASSGLIVIAPDSICFEDRRRNSKGTGQHPDDWLQHYNEMSYRLVRGDTLMRQVLEDGESAVSVLTGLDGVDPSRIGVLGHSYGGNTALFQAALDVRVNYACSSGAACSYADKMRRGTGIEMAEVLPNALARFEIVDLLRLVAPRQLLIASATEDPYSRDAEDLFFDATDGRSSSVLQHFRYEGGHALTAERFDDIVAWMVATSGSLGGSELVQASRSLGGA